MKIAVITLVSDNYGNKFQNYAVEQLLAEYGDVTTYPVEEEYVNETAADMSLLSKLKPSYIELVLKSRLLYQYDITNDSRTLLGNWLYVMKHKKELLARRTLRSKCFKEFSQKMLHVSPKVITHSNCNEEWCKADYYFCGSDQIWNPSYATTTDLAFLSFAPKEKTIAIAPSFGVSEIPEDRKEDYAKWLNYFAHLSVREEQGQEIIRDLTGREAQVLVDPTMALDVEQWEKMITKPECNLPDKFVLCYFLGRVNKQRRKYIEQEAKKMNAEIVDLFDIEKGEYYILNPAEVLYCVKKAEHILTDSFHGTVFSILLQKNFLVFDRDEGGATMSSRLTTLLNKFGLQEFWYQRGKHASQINEDTWKQVNEVLVAERKRVKEYISQCLN